MGGGRNWKTVELIDVQKKRCRGLAVWWWCGVARLLCGSVDPECYVFEEHICAFGLAPCCSVARRCWLKWNRAVYCFFSMNASNHSIVGLASWLDAAD